MASRGVYRGIHSSMLDDPDFQRLSPRAKHTLLTARLCRDAGPACIFRYYPEVLMRQTGYTRRQLDGALLELDREQWAYSDGSVLWIRNGLRHDPQLRIGDKKHLKAVLRQLDGLPSSSLVVRFCDYYKISRPLHGPSKTKLVQPSDTDTEILPEVLPDTDSARKALPPPDKPAALDRFAEFYGLYPRKAAPDAALRAWKTATKKASPDALIAALTRQLPEFARRPKDRVPYPATWLNGGQWHNEPSDKSSDDPYRDWPHLYDCQQCGGVHDKPGGCDRLHTSAEPA